MRRFREPHFPERFHHGAVGAGREEPTFTRHPDGRDCSVEGPQAAMAPRSRRGASPDPKAAWRRTLPLRRPRSQPCPCHALELAWGPEQARPS